MKRHAKMNLKRSLAVVMSFLMLMGAWVFVAPVATAAYGADKPASAISSDLTFIVPEVIYLAPDGKSWTESTASPFQYYVNNTSSGAPTAEVAQTTGKIYYSFAGASTATLSYSFRNQSLNDIDSTGASITLSSSTISSGGSVNITAGMSPSLGASTTGCYVRWELSYTDIADGQAKKAYAYSYVYKPYVVPIAAAPAAGTGSSKDAANWAGTLVWLSGMHSIIVDGMPDYSKSDSLDSYEANNYLRTDRAALFINSSNKAYISGSQVTSSSKGVASGSWAGVSSGYAGDVRYVSFNGTGNASANVMTGDNTYPTDYNRSSAGSDSYNVKNTTYAEYRGNNKDVSCIAVAKSIGSIYIDTSRYSNLKQIPNLAVGLTVTIDKNCDNGTGHWWMADHSVTSFNHRSTWYKTDESDLQSSVMSRDYIFASQGSDWHTRSYDTNEGIRYAGGWDRSLRNTSGSTQMYYVKGVYGNTDNVTLVGNYDANAVGYVGLQATYNNKAALRTAVQNAIKKMPALGITGDSSGSLTSIYFDASESGYKWTALQNAYKAAVQGLTRVDAGFDCATLASNLTNALNALCTHVSIVNADPNGGLLSGSSLTSDFVTVGTAQKATYDMSAWIATPNEGYKFRGWSTDTNATIGTVNSVTVGYNQTIYPIWVPVTSTESTMYATTWADGGYKNGIDYTIFNLTTGSTVAFTNNNATDYTSGSGVYRKSYQATATGNALGTLEVDRSVMSDISETGVFLEYYPFITSPVSSAQARWGIELYDPENPDGARGGLNEDHTEVTLTGTDGNTYTYKLHYGSVSGPQRSGYVDGAMTTDQTVATANKQTTFGPYNWYFTGPAPAVGESVTLRILAICCARHDSSNLQMLSEWTDVTITGTCSHAAGYTAQSTDASHLKTAADCENAAVYYKSCPTCGANGTATFESGSALNHTYAFDSFVWSNDGTTAQAKYVCGRNPSHVALYNASMSNDPHGVTCDTAGYTIYTASYDGHTATNRVDGQAASGHAWGDVTYIWSEDNTSVTAMRVCGNDQNHVETETVGATYAVVTAAKCGVAGAGKWTSDAFENEAFAVAIKDVEIPALVHDWNEPIYTWTASYDKCTATRTCNNGDHPQVETVNTTNEQTKDATCTAPGETTYYASFTNIAFEAQEKVVANIPATGHIYAEPADEDWTWTKTGSTYTATVTLTCTAGDSTETVEAIVAKTDEQAATHLVNGSKTFTATATIGRQTFTGTKVDVIEAEGHIWDYTSADVSYVWADDFSSCTATVPCKKCDETTDITTTDITCTPTVTATCKVEGIETYTANFTQTGLSAQTPKNLGTDANNHVNTTDTAETFSSCTVPGYTAGVYCNDCEQYISGHVEKALADHDHSVLQYDADGHWYKCANCDDTTAKVAHSGGTATCSAKATCSTCGQAYGSFDETNHSWNTPSYDWADDYSTCTATRTCAYGNHPQIETVTASSEKTKDETCTAAGETTYTATFTNGAFAEQTKVVANIQPTGHTYGEPAEPDWIWTKAGDTYTATVALTCIHSDSTVTVDAVVEKTDEQAASHLVDGSVTFTATATVGEQTFTATKTDPIAAGGHSWDYTSADVSYAWADDFSSCTATVPCSGCDETIDVTTTDITSASTVTATCKVEGIETYTANFTQTGLSAQAPKNLGTDATNHVNTTETAETSSSCTVPGYTAGVYCNDCEQYISGHVEKALADHDHSVLQYDAEGHWYKCTNCDDTTAKVAHSGGIATCTAKATCSTCGQTYGDYGAHDWNAPVFSWTDDYSSATATRTCRTNAAHTQNADSVTVNGEVTTPATATTPGEITYTATATFGTETFTDEKTAETDPADPDYEFDSFEWGDDFTAKVVVKDKNNGYAVVKIEATVTSESFGATCQANAYTRYTVSYDGHTDSQIDEQEGTKLDHSFTVLQSDAEGHWYKCATCDETTDPVAHTGGTATCSAQAVCEVCGASYGATADHDYTVLQHNATTHWYKCATCDETTEPVAHTGGTATCEDQAVCDVCGTSYGALADHDFSVVQSDANGHWFKCATCGETTAKENHTGGTATCLAKAVCEVCGTEYGRKVAHSFTNYVYDNNATCLANGTETAVCDHGCGTTNTRTKVASATGHNFGDWTVTTPATCSAEGVEACVCLNDSSHTMTRAIPKLDHVDADGDTLCDVCGGPTADHQHTDVNGDGHCDTCNAETNVHQHVDTNGDNICDDCGKAIDTSFRCAFCSKNDQMQASNSNGFVKFVYRVIHFIIHMVQGIRFSV